MEEKFLKKETKEKFKKKETERYYLTITRRGDKRESYFT